MATRRSYTPEQVEEAVSYAHEKGLAVAARDLDIPKTTIKTWADERGVDVADEAAIAKVEKATAVSRAARKQKVEEAKSRVTVLLAAVAELGAHAQINMLKSGEHSLAEAVGATTRAIHDLQLLEGRPTEISEDVTEGDLRKIRDELQEELDRESGTDAGGVAELTAGDDAT